MTTHLQQEISKVVKYVHDISSHNIKPKTKSYKHTIYNIENSFSKYAEYKTPKQQISTFGKWMGRLKFYGDNLLYLYLEVYPSQQSNNQTFRAEWPAKITWKVEIIDDNDDKRIHVIDQTWCYFHKPRQGDRALPNDWMKVHLDVIKNTGLIQPDGSIVLRWTVTLESVMYCAQVDDMKNILENVNTLIDQGESASNLCQKLKADVEKVMEIASNSERKIERISEQVQELALNLGRLREMHQDLKSSVSEICNSKYLITKM